MEKKKYSKIIVTLIICLSIICSLDKASAKERTIYFTNQNGVSLTKEEYDYLTELYWDGYQKIITETQYQKLIDYNVIGREVESNTILVPANPFTRGSSHTTYAKRLKITKACTENNCYMTTILEWFGTPIVKGYDVMGSYIRGVNIISTPTTVVSTPEETVIIDEDDMQMFDNGFGTSFMMPDGAKPIITQDFICTGVGRVYASYQHAMSALTKEESKQFTISGIGYGGVFEFTGKAKEFYDDMNGVDIAV